ncbi:E3 ubiquitin-protein ligase RLIM-like isoform X1 [Helicoverpa zea]|uniref:E3 ubiquitin-protein ligase RLIM-like isoform X1 n=1 Tax=Helicoverpa zea TaxID=7113 RepID=UPI001F5945FC|nr:E3 ubiquitin-protein ligase RLIM-like isoform X1 [Helicoverpa zea]
MSMSVREEERGKTTCPSRGLGIAAAAIGVGVGAALYYFFSKRPENPNSQGSTSDWNCEQQQAFSTPDTDDSYTTISENETSDTSVHNSLSEFHLSTSEYSIVMETSSEESSDDDPSSSEESDDTEMVDSDLPNDFEYRWVSLHNAITTIISAESEGHGVMGNGQWVETATSLGMPRDGAFSSMASFMGRVANLVSDNKKKKTENEQMNILRQQAFRQRSWTLEECSICFEVMLRDQEVMSLPCSHNFHSECILPWLQEKQTCPNCRKVAE